MNARSASLGCCVQGKWAAVALSVLAVIVASSSAASAAVVLYNATTGWLTLDDSGSNYDPALEDFGVYLSNVTPTPLIPSLSWSPTANWSVTTTQTPKVHDYSWASGTTTNPGFFSLTAGVYSLVQLAPGLADGDFGYNGGPGHVYGPGNTTGDVTLSDTSGTTFQDIVHFGRAVPSQVNWTSSSSTSWNVAGNWTVAGSGTQRVPLSSDTATFNNPALARTVNLNGSQSVGSLWLNSSAGYTIAAGSGGTLSISSTANIWIDAGLHTISAPVALSGSLTVDAESAGNVPPTSTGLIISGQVSGGAINKIGPGIVYLNNTTNTYTGTTSIGGGTLSAYVAGSLGTSGSVAISNGALDFFNGGTFARSIGLNGTGTNAIQTDAGVMTLSGIISGPGGLTKGGNGTLALSNSANSFGGGTNVTSGTLQLGAATAISGTSAIDAGAVLDLNGLNPTLPSISGNGTVSNNKPSTVATLAAYVGGTVTYGAAIQDGTGRVALSVPAGGSLVLGNSSNTYSAGTTVGGTLSASAAGNLGSGTIQLNGGILQATSGFALDTGNAIALTGSGGFDVTSGQTLTIAGVLSGDQLTKTGLGRLLLTGVNTFNGNSTISAGNLAVNADAALGNSAGTVTINGGSLEFTNDATSAHTINLAVAQSYIQVDSGVVSQTGLLTGSGGLVKTGTGTLNLVSPNTYGGQTTVGGGVLMISDPTGQALGTGTLPIQVGFGAQLAGTGTVSQPVTCSGGTVAPGSNTIPGTLFLQQGITFNNGSGATFKLTNQISGDGVTPVSDTIDLEPALQGDGSLGTIGGLRTSGTNTFSFTGTPVPITSTTYKLFDHYHTSNGDSPSVPGGLSLVAPPGYSAALSLSPQMTDFSSFPPTTYWQILAQFTGPTEWTFSGGTGSWSDNNNWSNGTPPEVVGHHEGSPAMFGTNGAGTVTLRPNDPNYVTVLILNNTSSSYTIAGPSGGSLSLTSIDSRGVDAGNAVIEVVSGSHTITAPVVLASDTNVTMFDPAAQLTMSGAISGSGAMNLSGPGALILSASNNSFSGAVDVNNSGILVLTNPGALVDGDSITLGDPTLFSSPAPIALESAASPTVSAVPEPSAMSTLVAAGAGLALLLGVGRRSAFPSRFRSSSSRSKRT